MFDDFKVILGTRNRRPGDVRKRIRVQAIRGVPRLIPGTRLNCVINVVSLSARIRRRFGNSGTLLRQRNVVRSNRGALSRPHHVILTRRRLRRLEVLRG